jgi:hypothetical protein
MRGPSGGCVASKAMMAWSLIPALLPRGRARPSCGATNNGDLSMPTTPRPPQIIPYLFYRDAPAALDFLCRAFGFKEEMRAGTPSGGMHGEASFQGQLVMIGQGAHERSLTTPKEAGAATMGSSISKTSTGITRSPRRRGRRSSIRRRTSRTAAPTGRPIPKAIPGSSRRRPRRGEFASNATAASWP